MRDQKDNENREYKIYEVSDKRTNEHYNLRSMIVSYHNYHPDLRSVDQLGLSNHGVL